MKVLHTAYTFLPNLKEFSTRSRLTFYTAAGRTNEFKMTEHLNFQKLIGALLITYSSVHQQSHLELGVPVVLHIDSGAAPLQNSQQLTWEATSQDPA
jgi:hypothetical protein